MNDEKNQLFVVSGELIQQILNNISEQKLKDSFNLYVALQQGVQPLESYLESQKTPGNPPDEK